MRNLFALIAVLVLPLVAHAAPGAHGDEIPWGMITNQSINVVLVLLLLTFLLRKKIATHFKTRSEGYNALLNKAEAAKKEAEENKREIAEKLAKIEKSAETATTQAQQEALELKNKILEDAKGLSAKLKEEAKRTVDFEIQRAKEEIRKDLLSSALEDARQSMESGAKASDLQKLQTEFAQRVQVVRQ